MMEFSGNKKFSRNLEMESHSNDSDNQKQYPRSEIVTYLGHDYCD